MWPDRESNRATMATAGLSKLGETRSGRNLLPLLVRASNGIAVHMHAERGRTADIYRALKTVCPCGIASDG
jgi:hypothetical protein